MTERDQLEQAIAALETQRATLGDAAVEAALVGLRHRLAELERGGATALAPLTGERKLVTVMFADISGFTSLAETMDPEAVRDLVNACFERLVPVVKKYEGTVDKFTGDGIMALFGAPVAHEDDPVRALRAALEMIEALQAFSVERETDLGIHFGINTGHVIAGGLGTQDRQEYSVMGDAVNLAARLEGISERGEILVGPDTYRLTRPLFEFKILEPVRIKGKAEPVQVYTLLSAKEVRGKVRGIEGLESPLVGRDDESRALREAIERLRSGVGGIVTVVGEAGLGKSRLVTEVREQTLAKDSEPSQGWAAQWVEGRCLSYGGSIAYLLWLDVLRGLLGIRADVTPLAARDALREQVQTLCPDRVDGVYPYLGRLMSLPLADQDENALRGLDSESLKNVTFRAVETLVEYTARQQPLAIVCEDLHWADPTSIALLEQLIAATDRVPLLLICVFRPETTHLCWRIKEAAARRYRHRHTDLWLDPLSADESAALVGNLLRIEDVPTALRSKILRRTEGNPFYVEEIIRSLIDSGVIVHDEATDRWQATQKAGDIALPDTLHGVLMARIDRLQEKIKRILQLASVIGRVFLYHVLAEIAQEEQELDEHLLTLQREQMIRERVRVPELEYIFKHHLTQEAAYDSLLKREQRAYHRQVAEALEQVFPERIEEQLGLLAHHWEGAGEAEKAVHYLRRAGERTAAQFANVEAVEYFSRALDLTPKEDLDGRYALISAREAVYNVQGMRGEQRQDLAALVEIARAFAQREDRTEAIRKRAEVALREANHGYLTADYLAAADAGQRAIHLAQATGDVGLEAQGYLHWGNAIAMSDDRRDGQLLLEKAMALARRAGSRALEAGILRELGVSSNLQEEHDQAKRYLERALRIWREIGNRMEEGRALSGLNSVALHTFDWAGARSYAEESLHLFRLTGNRREEGYVLGALGYLSCAQGDYATSQCYYEQSLRCFREAEDRLGEGVSLQGQGLLAHEMGDDSACLHFSQQALDIGEAIDSDLVQARALLSLGHALAGLEHLEEARDAYQRALTLWQSLGLSTGMRALAGLARVSLSEGNLSQARAHVEQILEAAQANPALYGTYEPSQIYLTCYHVLLASDDPRAQEVLEAAYRQLQETAHKIEDEELRRSYLENVSAHREIVSEFAQGG
jgi:predicted ATPase/class 3 adenylate cyclase